MKLDVSSDLHVDNWTTGMKRVQWDKIKNPGSDILLICGDTSNIIGQSLEMVKRAVDVYNYVFFVDGNHEHWYFEGSINDLYRKVNDAVRQYFPDKALFFDGSNFKLLGDTLFIGANLWYDCSIMEPEIQKQDQWEYHRKYDENLRYINFAPYESPIQWAGHHTAMLQLAVQKVQDVDEIKKIVITTHTAPIKQCLPITGNKAWDTAGGCYGNSIAFRILEADKKKKIKLWAYGHTHRRMDFIHNGVRFVNNVRGYENEIKEQQYNLLQVEV